jgi:hypothetical protein
MRTASEADLPLLARWNRASIEGEGADDPGMREHATRVRFP